jgi:hypothetical protein
MVVRAYNPSTGKAELGGFQVLTPTLAEQNHLIISIHV